MKVRQYLSESNYTRHYYYKKSTVMLYHHFLEPISFEVVAGLLGVTVQGERVRKALIDVNESVYIITISIQY